MWVGGTKTKTEEQKKHTRHGNKTYQAHRVDLWRIGEDQSSVGLE